MSTRRIQGRHSKVAWIASAAFIASCGGESDTATGGGADTGTTSTGTGRPPRETSDATEGEGLPCDVAATLRTNCWGCHGAVPASGAPYSLITRDELTTVVDGAESRGARAVARMRSPDRPMPPRGAALVQEGEVAAIEAWLAAGAPPEVCTTPTDPDCVTCEDTLEDMVACVPAGTEAPNLCDEDSAISFRICAGRDCGAECGVAPPGQEAPPCDIENGDVCRACLNDKCGVALEACGS